MQRFDSFDEEDEGGDEFASFEEFGAREARKLRGYLEELDRRVLDAEAVVVQEPAQEQRAKPRRYYALGYDAHQELVTDKDLVEWQRAFPQLRVCGVQIPIPSAEAEAEGDEHDETQVADVDNEIAQEVKLAAAADSEDREPDLTMAVRGTRLPLHAPTRPQEVTQFPHKRDFAEYGATTAVVAAVAAAAEEEEPETVLCMDGILEEVIAIDHSGDARAADRAGAASPPVSPTSARKYEMSSLLLDSVWPSVVEALRPLVERVVRHQLEHGLPAEEEGEPPVQRSEWSDIDEGDGDGDDQPAMPISAW